MDSDLSPSDRAKFEQALALHQAGRLVEARALYREVLVGTPRNFRCLHSAGIAAMQSGDRQSALDLIERAIEVDPNVAAAHSNCGSALLGLGSAGAALESYDRALALDPSNANTYSNRGNALLQLERYDEALASYDQALRLNPNHPEANFNRGNALQELGFPEEAVASFDTALRLNPNNVRAHNNRGNALADLRRLPEALASYDRALQLESDNAKTHNNRGIVLAELKRLDEALISYGRALQIQSDYAEAYNNRGNAYVELNRFDEAAADYGQALRYRPDYEFLFGLHLHTRMKLCDWNSLADDRRRIETGIRRRERVSPPFPTLALLDDPLAQKAAAELYVAAKHPRGSLLGSPVGRPPDGKIRLAYYSADFHNHATACLMAELLEAHDRGRFEVYGFSFGPSVQDELRRRVAGAFHRFIEVNNRSDREVALLSRALGVDIAVDLKGHTNDSRPKMFAERCAPVQVSYLGYPGTTGANYIDYVVGDSFVIPPEKQAEFTEKVVYLPQSYQANDSQRKIANWSPSRKELGLPQRGFVFCCFNNSYKILPEVFDRWMSMLKAVEGSVLWLLEDNPTAATNLRRAALARGVASTRLVFAPRLPFAEHLARHRQADLFVDTVPCNAHTTASDALWAGLPVLTCMGNSFAGRVAASLLNAVGLADLVTRSLSDYEAAAIELATTPGKIDQVKERLAMNRLASPLFDGKRLAIYLESAYETMYARQQAGLPADTIRVTA